MSDEDVLERLRALGTRQGRRSAPPAGLVRRLERRRRTRRGAVVALAAASAGALVLPPAQPLRTTAVEVARDVLDRQPLPPLPADWDLPPSGDLAGDAAWVRGVRRAVADCRLADVRGGEEAVRVHWTGAVGGRRVAVAVAPQAGRWVGVQVAADGPGDEPGCTGSNEHSTDPEDLDWDQHGWVDGDRRTLVVLGREVRRVAVAGRPAYAADGSLAWDWRPVRRIGDAAWQVELRPDEARLPSLRVELADGSRRTEPAGGEGGASFVEVPVTPLAAVADGPVLDGDELVRVAAGLRSSTGLAADQGTPLLAVQRRAGGTTTTLVALRAPEGGTLLALQASDGTTGYGGSAVHAPSAPDGPVAAFAHQGADEVARTAVVVPRGTAQVRVGARTAATDGRLVLLDGAPRAGDEVVARDADGRVLGRGRVVLPLDERLARGLAGPP